ncbi:MAG: GNAT family N-acetyltransferase [Sporichthyaceae bacterium]
MATFTVRDAGVGDFPAAAAIRAANEPDRIISTEGMTVWMGDLPERAALGSWLAADDGGPVGWAMAMRSWTQPDDGIGSVDVVVAPGRQREGVGTVLAERVRQHCTDLGLHTVRAMSLDTASARAMAARHGFRETFASTTSTVDPRTVSPGPVPPGVRLVPFADLDDPAPVFALDLEVSQDVPGDESFESMTLADWSARFWRSPVVDDDCSLLLYVGDEPAGLTLLRVDRPTGRAHNNITGVRRAHRGRGLARLLKSHSLHRAGELGVTVAATDNDETNAPMLAVNTTLGYRPSSRRVEWERGPRDA